MAIVFAAQLNVNATSTEYGCNSMDMFCVDGVIASLINAAVCFQSNTEAAGTAI